MNIISDFNDYYDPILNDNSGECQSDQYYRKTEDVSYSLAYKIKDALKVDSKIIRRFIESSWSITPFIIGFCGRFNKGIEIISGDQKEFAYTLTGAKFLPDRMNINLSDHLVRVIEEHFEEWNITNNEPFKLANASSLVVYPDVWNRVIVIANPNLSEYCFQKVCPASSAFAKILPFAKDFLLQGKIESPWFLRSSAAL
jgi:hypothetical protein